MRRVDKILNAAAFREYKSYMDKKDVIREGVIRQFTMDFYVGLIEHWEMVKLGIVLQKRMVVRVAMQADLADVAAFLAQRGFPPMGGGTAPAQSDPAGG